jgi:signal peptidase I
MARFFSCAQRKSPKAMAGEAHRFAMRGRSPARVEAKSEFANRELRFTVSGVTDAPAPTNPEKTQRNWVAIALPIGAALVAIALVATRMTVAASYTSKSGSMLPTLELGEHVLVNKLDKVPQRGKMIVFRYPENPTQEFIKRIVGMPGDTIEVKGKTLFVNGKPAPVCLVGDYSYKADENETVAGELSMETLDGARYLVLHTRDTPAMAAGPWKVKEGEVFVLGDNREMSHDSRMWNGGAGGGVPLDRIVGTVQGRAKPMAAPKGTEGLTSKLHECLTRAP